MAMCDMVQDKTVWHGSGQDWVAMCDMVQDKTLWHPWKLEKERSFVLNFQCIAVS